MFGGNRAVKIRYDVLVDGAIAKTKALGHATADLAKRGGKSMDDMAEKVRKNEKALDSMAGRMGIIGAAAAAGLGIAGRAFMGFDQQMSGVQAVAGATAEEMDQLREAAIELGASTIFSASEVAEAQGELARAGVAVQDMLGGGLKGALDLAAAGGLGLAEASTIAAQAMNLFNLEGSEVPRIADVLASGANKSAADVSDLGQALQQAGTVASQTGLSLEETVGALSMFADQGIRGSDAGTSLKTMLQRLTPTSKQAQRVMEDLGFSAYDASGEFIGLEALAGELQDSFGGLDTQSRNAALGVAFGSDAIRGAAILMEQGADGARDYVEAMQDTGAAAEMAGVMTDNLAGDIEELGGAIETGLIQSGSLMNDMLRGTVQGLTGLVDLANDAPRSLQGIAIGIGGIVAAGGIGGGLVLKLGTSLVSLGDDIASIAGRATKTSTALSRLGGILTGPWGIALAGGVALLGAYAIEQGRTRVRVQELTDSLDEQTGAITENTEETAKATLQKKGAYDAAERLGINLDLVTRAALGEKDAMTQLNRELQGYSVADKDIRTRKGGLTSTERDYRAITGAIFGVNVELEEAKRLWAQSEEASVKATGSWDSGVIALTNLGGALADYAVGLHDAAGGADLFLTRSERMELMGEDGMKALLELREQLGEVDSSFINVNDALAANDEKAREWAEGQAEAAGKGKESWQDYVEDAKFSLDTFLGELEKQVQAQNEWETNMLILSTRMSEQAWQALYDMGPAGAQAAAAFVEDGGKGLDRWEEVVDEKVGAGSQAAIDAMIDGVPAMRAAAAVLGEEAAAEIARQLIAGETTVAEVVEQYDLQAWVELGTDEDSYRSDLGLLIGFTEDQRPVIPIDAENAPALGVALGTVGEIDGMEGTVTVYANNDPADGELGELMVKIDTSWGTVNIAADDWNARAVLQGFLGLIPRSVTVGLNAVPLVGGMFGMIPGFSTGGDVPGWSPSPTADNILMLGTAKEFVTRVDSAESMRRDFPGWLEHINHYGRPPGYATGGTVGVPPRSTYPTPVAAPSSGPATQVAPGALDGMRIEGQLQMRDGEAYVMGVLRQRGRDLHGAVVSAQQNYGDRTVTG